MYLLAPRSPRYFHPEVVGLLAQSNGNPNRCVVIINNYSCDALFSSLIVLFSKKDSLVRAAELLEGIGAELLKVFETNHIWNGR